MAVDKGFFADDPTTGFQRRLDKGVANGYASLDGSIRVPSTQLPVGIRNANTTDVVASAVDTYLTGSALVVPLLQIGMRLKWRFWMTKSALGLGAPVWNVRVGTLGTIADASRLTFTAPAQTPVVDTGRILLDVIVRSIGATGVIAGVLSLHHNSPTGIIGFSTSICPVIQAVSSPFDMTIANLIVGVSVDPGAAGVWTHQGVLGEVVGI